MSTLDRILTSIPVNRTARSVTWQGHCETDRDLNRAELLEIINRLTRKHRLLKHVLRIDNKPKHKNLIYKYEHNIRTCRSRDNPRAVVEYVRVGKQMQLLIQRVCVLKKEYIDARTLARSNESSGAT